MQTELHLIANETGTFRGSSANISGEGFAGMVFKAVSSTQGEFESWVSKVKNSPYELTKSEYEQLAMPSKYEPVIYYSSVESDLFQKIVRKYMPKKEN